MQKECDNCGGTDFVETKEVGSVGLGGPDLLPGTGFVDHACFTLRICAQCGKVSWWVLGDDLEKVKKSSNFRQLNLET
jgi:hypothetical protein